MSDRVGSGPPGRPAGPDGLRFEGFLADWRSEPTVVDVAVDAAVQHLEVGRHGVNCNFDFLLKGVTERTLELVFIKVAVYDAHGYLVTYRYLNRNAIGPSSVETVVNTRIVGRRTTTLFNPFHTFPLGTDVHRLRFMFTFEDVDTGERFYDGTVSVAPVIYDQEVELDVPVRGLVTVLDGHDYLSHHRRFDVTMLRQATQGAIQSNSFLYALDFVHVGPDGNTRRIPPGESASNYDYTFVDARRFYSHGEFVYAPAAGEVVTAVDGLPDLYDAPFDWDAATRDNRTRDLAGNYVVVRHNDREFSHLYHLLNGSVRVSAGQSVARGDVIGQIGFSGAANLYAHLHYQLLDGPDFLTAAPLPIRFRHVAIVKGNELIELADTPLDTADTIWNPPDSETGLDSA